MDVSNEPYFSRVLHVSKKGRQNRRNWADRKANLTLIREQAQTSHRITPRGPAPTMPGFSLIQIGPVIVVLPTLLDSAPEEVQSRYYARAISNATGRCPICTEVASSGLDRAEITHDNDCPVLAVPGDTSWFDPRHLETVKTLRAKDKGHDA